MKRKGLIMLAVTAMLTVGAVSVESYAAEGWAQSGSTWVYYDTSGNKVTNTWKKGADNLWRYLNTNGEMSVNTILIIWTPTEFWLRING